MRSICIGYIILLHFPESILPTSFLLRVITNKQFQFLMYQVSRISNEPLNEASRVHAGSGEGPRSKGCVVDSLPWCLSVVDSTGLNPWPIGHTETTFGCSKTLLPLRYLTNSKIQVLLYRYTRVLRRWNFGRWYSKLHPQFQPTDPPFNLLNWQ